MGIGSSLLQNFAPQQPVLPAPTATFQHEERAFTLHNIADKNLLKVDVDGMKHTIMKNNKQPGEYRVEYTPEGGEHRVRVQYAGVDVPGTPFNLMPRRPTVEHHAKEKMFTIKNIYEPHLLNVSSPSLQYQMFKDKTTPTTFHVLHQPNDGVHDVSVTYKNKPVTEFRLAPRPNPQLQRQQMAQHEQTGAPMLQMLPNGQAVQLGNVQQAQFQQGMAVAAPALTMAPQTAAPIMPVAAAPGHQPMMPMPQQPQPAHFQPIMANGPPTFQTPL